MSLTQNTRDYEILVRFNENGKVGAYRQTITEVLDGNQILASSTNNPEPLDLEGLNAAIALITEQDWFVPEEVQEESEV